MRRTHSRSEFYATGSSITVVLIAGVVLMAVLTLSRVDYDLASLYSIARERMDEALTGNHTGALSSLYSTLSLVLALPLALFAAWAVSMLDALAAKSQAEA